MIDRRRGSRTLVALPLLAAVFLPAAAAAFIPREDLEPRLRAAAAAAPKANLFYLERDRLNRVGQAGVGAEKTRLGDRGQIGDRVGCEAVQVAERLGVRYFTYGKTRRDRLFFQGRELDPATGLYDFRNRWYSPQLGRFLTRDPLGYPDGPNAYGAFLGDPVNGSDPMGTSVTTWLKGLAEGTANLVVGMAETVSRSQNPSAMADPFQRRLNFTNPNQPWVVESLRNPVEEAKAATIVWPIGQTIGHWGASAYLTGEGWFDETAPQDYLDEIHADFGRDTPAMVLIVAPLKGIKGSKVGPYAELGDGASVTIGPGRLFTRNQKRMILEANEQRNGGVLRSDLSGTELVRPIRRAKGLKVPPNEAQLDHMDPRARGGTNDFGNAQVLSIQENLVKSDKPYVPPTNWWPVAILWGGAAQGGTQ